MSNFTFKKGDRVHWTKFAGESSSPIASWFNKRVGVVGTIQKDFSGTPNDLVLVQWDGNNGLTGYFPKRLQLCNPVLTDEELAARYRESRIASLADFDELNKRGYKITQPAYSSIPMKNYGSDVLIFKFVEEEVVVTEKKQVRKEI